MKFIEKIDKKINNIYRRLRVFIWKFKMGILYGNQVSINSIFFLNNFTFDVVSDKFKVEFNKVIFRDNCKIRIRKNGILRIGQNIFFNSGCSINCMIGIDIGHSTLFGENVKIYDHNHKFNETDKLITNQDYSLAPIKIGSNCWIGSNVVILKGVQIGDNVVIGANCLIYENIASNSVVKTKSDLIVNKLRTSKNI